ncbi:hypothetical protein Hesp01_28700 [Herbidospora sp. NBRC 101105]|nr:hypothetical protein Hesp01_28700 [Herbidospora sp. NBRC 101105]
MVTGIRMVGVFAGGTVMARVTSAVGRGAAGMYASVFAGTWTRATGLISTGIVTGTARKAVVGVRTTGSGLHAGSADGDGWAGRRRRARTARGSRMVSLRSQVTSAKGPRTSA